MKTITEYLCEGICDWRKYSLLVLYGVSSYLFAWAIFNVCGKTNLDFFIGLCLLPFYIIIIFPMIFGLLFDAIDTTVSFSIRQLHNIFKWLNDWYNSNQAQ